MNFNHSKVIQGALFLVSILLSACGGGGSSGSNSSSTPLSARTAVSDALFTDAASAVSVTVAMDAARAVSQAVGPVGGTLSATGADGSQFTLTIPANALQQSTTITMTPISSVAGLPLNGFVAGVQFAPDGLLLEKEATLTIVPSVSVPVGDQTFLGYSGAGNDLHLVSPASPGQAIQMLIGHFSGSMLGSGTPAQRAAFYLSRAQDSEARLNQEIGRVLSQARQKALLGTDDGTIAPASIDSYFASSWELVIQSYVAAANTSCSNAKLAQRAYLGFERKYAVMGLTNPYDPNGTVYQQILNEINTQCNALPNRYAGTFTDNTVVTGLTNTGASGTVTFLRDDAACVAAGVYTANTACYRVESVAYTFTTPTMTGCTVTPATYAVSLVNTPLSGSYLSYLSVNLTSTIDPTSGLPAYKYLLIAGWNPPSYSITITCPPALSYTGNTTPFAALASYPGTTTPGLLLINGSSTVGGSRTYTWSLNAAP